MLQPIHVIDLLYYKRMFIHINSKANEDKEEDQELSPTFVQSFVERAFAFVEEVFNSDNSFHLDGLAVVMSEMGFAGNLIEYVEIEISKLREKALKNGWDPRVKIKVTERRIGQAYQTLFYSMDLEATHEAMKQGEEIEVYESAFTDKDIVDNPSVDQLNAWFNRETKKAPKDA